MKTINTVLCLLCIATVTAIVLKHARNQPEPNPMEDVTAYFGGGSEWTSTTDRTTTRLSANPFSREVAGGDSVGSNLTPAEQRQGVERWRELHELAQTPVEPKPSAAHWRAKRAAVAKANGSKRRAAGSVRANRRLRRSKTIFEQTRHYDRYQQNYRNPGKNTRRGLRGNRAPRSRYQ